MRAARLRAIQIPRPRLEAVRLRRERADGTELGDVPGEVVAVRRAGCRRDDVAVAAILDDELLVAHDNVVEAHAALADDATLLVENDRRAEIDRLRFAVLRVDDVGRAPAVRHCVILKVALAALIANRAIQRMIDEQQLDHRRASRLGLLAARAHDHAVRRRRVAGDLQLRHAFDLDEADAAEPRRTELRVIAVNRDFLLHGARGFDEQRALGNFDGDAVDRQLHVIAGHERSLVPRLRSLRSLRSG